MNTLGPADALDDVLRPALEQSSIAIVLIDETDRIRFYNHAAERLWGFGPEQVLGRDVTALLPASLDDVHGGYMRRNRAGAAPRDAETTRELRLRRSDGREIWAHFSVSRIDAGGRICHMVFLRDVSEEVVRREEHRLLLLAINHTDRAMLVLDRDHGIVRANPAFSELLGYEADEVYGRQPSHVLASPRIDPAILGRVRQHGRENVAFQEEILAVRKDGRDIWLRMAVNPVFDAADGSLRNMVVVFADITERRLIQDLQRDVLAALTSGLSFEDLGNFLCRRVAEIVGGVLPSILRVDAEGRLRSWAVEQLPAAYRFTADGEAIGEGRGSCGTAAARGKPVLVADIATDPLWDGLRHEALTNGLRACWSYPIFRRQGSVAATFAFYARAPRMPTQFLERIIDACVHLCALAIEREEARQQLARLVRFDPLTGLPNRSHLLQHIDEMLDDPATAQAAFFVLDLDGFKDVNASLGHAAGDALLVTMANRLQANLGRDDYLCRISADSFVIVSRGCDVRCASLLAERLLHAVAEGIEVGGHDLHLTASVGISHYPGGGRGRDVLLSSASHALNRAKAAGGGVSQFFAADMNRMARERLLLGTALKRAVAGGGLRLEYQPQVYVQTGELYGVEALARWCDPVFGDIPPSRFIGLAEEIGVIDALGRWALREACRQMACWRAQGVPIPAVSVNLSPLSFRVLDLPGYISELLREYALEGRRLTLEITESATMALTPEMMQAVCGIRALGVGLAVDDFGTGFSSLSNLVDLPVSEVKIDRSFIAKSLSERRPRALVEAVIGIGRSLNLTVVAEGVETAAEHDLLREHGCPVVQGWLVSRALPPAELAAWLGATREALPPA